MNELPPAPPAFSGVHFWATDMAASATFYRMVGFAIPEGAEAAPIVQVKVAEGVTFAFGSPALTLGYHTGYESATGRGANCLQFNLESRGAVDAIHERLTGAGYRSHLAPFDAFWGARYCEVLDPDSNAIGFHSPRDASRGGPPPVG